MTITLSEILDKYILTLSGKGSGKKATLKKSPAQQTLVETKKELSRFVSWLSPNKDPETISPPEIEHYIQQIAPSSSELTSKLTILKSFLAYINASGFSSTKLSNHVRIPKVTRAIPGLSHSTRPEDDVLQLTDQGLKNLSEELDLRKGKRTEHALDIKNAAADKDVRENSPLEAAREQQGQNEDRIKEIEAILSRAVPVQSQAKRSKIASLGSTVQITIEQGTNSSGKSEASYILVESTEADPEESKISISSPVGKGLLGHSPGDEVTITTPKGQSKYTILAVS